MAKVVTFGEIMLRLKSPGYERLFQSPSLEATFGGGEANVSISLANYGMDTAFVSVLPKNEIGDACVRELRSFGVDVSNIIRRDGRMGIYFLETGAVQRPSKVIYDRAGSAICEAKPGDIDWKKAFDGATWFHLTGITPAISQGAADLSLEAVKCAKAMGLHDSGDLARELLHYAALLHDIGIFISFSRHNAHSHYLIRNTELLGFTRREVDIMAALTYFHRKRPSKKVPLFMEFDQETREEIRLLSLFLLLAERMDKSHRQIVRTVRFEARKEGGLQLSLRAPEECPIELDLVRGSAKLVRKVFRQEIPVEVVSSFRR